jgi:hypothetical protein
LLQFELYAVTVCLVPVGFFQITFVPLGTDLKAGFHVLLEVALILTDPPSEGAGNATTDTTIATSTTFKTVDLINDTPSFCGVGPKLQAT